MPDTWNLAHAVAEPFEGAVVSARTRAQFGTSLKARIVRKAIQLEEARVARSEPVEENVLYARPASPAADGPPPAALDGLPDQPTVYISLGTVFNTQFPEVFAEYERSAVDAVLFSSYGIPGRFDTALRAHAGLNCLWISAATPAQTVPDRAPAGIVGPDGKWAARCLPSNAAGFAEVLLDRQDPAYDIALNKARPWRRLAREGAIYRERLSDDPRSRCRDEF